MGTERTFLGFIQSFYLFLPCAFIYKKNSILLEVYTDCIYLKFLKNNYWWSKMKILYIEDNEIIAGEIKKYLKKENIDTDIATTIREAESLMSINLYSLILLDIMLPDGDGIEFYRYTKQKYNVPTIFLTAKSSEDDIVTGIDLGADDYIVKPFSMRELTSRIKNAIKRKNGSEVIGIKNILFDGQNNVISKDGKPVDLTALEYRILTILLENINKIVTREYLLERIWDISSNFVNDNTLTVYIKRLREKIEDDPNSPKIIKTVRGMGYKIEKNK